ncbi:uncharacterized protein LOC135116036 [Scylla paramamosain]|uniref:uncharacterized protein LOC135116036 n=1 Tax=Scylla paramamosain TaxID=85552 RepID=UPI003082FD87
MKLLVALCLMAAGVSAQYGQSGIVFPDGRLKQFTREEADNVAEIGESGVVFKDGSHKQFDMEFATLHNNLPAPARPEPVAFGPYSYTGIVMPDGNNRQFTHDEHTNILVVGPSGVVTADGKNLQLDQEGLPLPLRRKRGASEAVVGESGIITPSGQLIQLPPGVSVVAAGPSAALLSTGKGIQYDRKKRAAPSKAVVGDGGIITPGGVQFQLPHGVYIVSKGPSAALLSNGEAVQYDEKKKYVKPGPYGATGIVMPDGKNVQFTHDQSANVAVVGPSGVVMVDGRNVQLNDEGLPSRKKRSKPVVGDSGYITASGRPVQFPHGVTILIAGDTGLLLSNGEAVQLYE